MKYLYKDGGFDFGHWVLQMLNNFVSILFSILRILTLNLIWFDSEVTWFMFRIKTRDKINNFLKRIK